MAPSGRRRAPQLAAGRIGQGPNRQVHVVPELPVQFLSGRGRPGRQFDPERWLPAPSPLRIWVPDQRARLLAAQPGEDNLEVIPNDHAGEAIERPHPPIYIKATA